MLKNQQPIEKVVRSDGTTVDVHSMFPTIQGEGPFCGEPSVFIRLAGCNLQCPLCDTEYSSKRTTYPIHEVVELTKDLHPVRHKRKPRLVVITGGEPFRQRLDWLIHYLILEGFKVQVETNGTVLPFGLTQPVTGLHIVCSPKSGKVNPAIEKIACCYKYVLSAASVCDVDGLPLHALEHSANPMLARPPVGYDKPIYLQPADQQDEELNEANRKAVVASCLKHGYTLQLQIHKLLGLE